MHVSRRQLRGFGKIHVDFKETIEVENFFFIYAPHMTKAKNRARTAVAELHTRTLFSFNDFCVHRECVIVPSGTDISGL